MGWTYLGILTLAALIACCCGFKKYVWFLSIGYGFAIAVIGIVLIVFGAQRLEKRQVLRYGKSEAYNAYANKTPIILPLIPIYHLNNIEKLLAEAEKKADQ